MSYCINPQCSQRQNPKAASHCQTCHTPLLIQGRYRLLYPLREPDTWHATEVFAIADGNTPKVLKLLKNPRLQPLFQREVEALQRLCHAGIPKAATEDSFTLSLASGLTLYGLVMEQIEGETLEQWVNKYGAISQALALNWLHQLLEILSVLHQSGLFHRDIKPSNLMRRPNGQLVLIDFGTVRQISATYLAKVGGQQDITSIVSPGYTPLEQINGKAVPQSDFYALGRSLVFLLTGQSPLALSENTANGTLHWRQQAPQVEAWFAELIDQLMAPFPGQRPPNTEMILQRLRSPQMTRLPNRSTAPWAKILAIANVGLLVVQLIVGWYWWQAHQARSPGYSGLMPDFTKHYGIDNPAEVNSRVARRG
ncbi:protein kinase domain-containing protein [Almyronema epifaneia]|uniref:non-specific serine/threonine protein kinase n=1 Tax=Almyronema epifaneia S1 TaxID=2991925 RepID=A0ABW6IAE3_9CYAN